MVGLSGVEPLTSPLSGVRSNQLSYRPLWLPFASAGLPACRHQLFPDSGGADRDRTGDLLNANQALSQLSYSPRYSAPSGATAPIALLPERQPRSRSYWSDSPLWSALLIRALVRPINHLILCGEIGLEAPYGSIPFLIDERNVLNPPGDIGYRLNGSTLEACLRGTKERVVN